MKNLLTWVLTKCQVCNDEPTLKAVEVLEKSYLSVRKMLGEKCLQEYQAKGWIKHE